MTYLLRPKLKASYEDERNDWYTKFGKIPENHQLAIDMRMAFFTEYVLNKNVCDYDTPVEKDWMYIAKREYRYDVNLRAMLDSMALGLLGAQVRMVMLRKFVIWPAFAIAPVFYVYRQNELFQFYNKKFFDMCNVGEQYEVGFARNVVLRKCNAILNRQDF